MAREFIDTLGNENALEKILFLHGTPPYYTARAPCTHSKTLRDTVVCRDVSYSRQRFVDGLERGSRPELWFMTPVPNETHEVCSLWPTEDGTLTDSPTAHCSARTIRETIRETFRCLCKSLEVDT